jgi:hypothetical protein
VYSLVVVVVEIRGQRSSLVLERYAPAPEVPNAFSLDRPVKALNMSIVIGPVQSGMSRGNAIAFHDLLKVPPVLRAIVGLHHGDGHIPFALCLQYRLCSQSWAELWCQGDMRHPSEQVNDGVVIQPSATCWIDVVNGIGFDQLTGCRNVWPPGGCLDGLVSFCRRQRQPASGYAGRCSG